MYKRRPFVPRFSGEDDLRDQNMGSNLWEHLGVYHCQDCTTSFTKDEFPAHEQYCTGTKEGGSIECGRCLVTFSPAADT